MPDPQRWTCEELALLVAKVDRQGMRGATLLSIDEIAAMAANIAVTGAVARLLDHEGS